MSLASSCCLDRSSCSVPSVIPRVTEGCVNISTMKLAEYDTFFWIESCGRGVHCSFSSFLRRFRNPWPLRSKEFERRLVRVPQSFVAKNTAVEEDTNFPKRDGWIYSAAFTVEILRCHCHWTSGLSEIEEFHSQPQEEPICPRLSFPPC